MIIIDGSCTSLNTTTIHCMCDILCACTLFPVCFAGILCARKHRTGPREIVCPPPPPPFSLCIRKNGLATPLSPLSSWYTRECVCAPTYFLIRRAGDLCTKMTLCTNSLVSPPDSPKKGGESPPPQSRKKNRRGMKMSKMKGGGVLFPPCLWVRGIPTTRKTKIVQHIHCILCGISTPLRNQNPKLQLGPPTQQHKQANRKNQRNSQ